MHSLQHGAMAYGMALWPTAWHYGLQHGTMAYSMACGLQHGAMALCIAYSMALCIAYSMALCIAYGMALWPTAWRYGLQHGLWPAAWRYGLQHGAMACSMACGLQVAAAAQQPSSAGRVYWSNIGLVYTQLEALGAGYDLAARTRNVHRMHVLSSAVCCLCCHTQSGI